jgi:hypothetical protein
VHVILSAGPKCPVESERAVKALPMEFLHLKGGV